MEDEEYLLESITALLTDSGLHVLRANTGSSALNQLGDKDFHIDLIFLDLNLPDISARELLEKLEAQCSNIPVFATSGNPREYSLAQLGGKKVSDFIQKPYSPKAVITRIERLLEANTGVATK